MSEFHVEPDAIDRRSFVRRLFAIGAGIAASGELVRAVKTLMPPPAPPKDAYEAMMRWYSNLDVSLAPRMILSRGLRDDYIAALEESTLHMRWSQTSAEWQAPEGKTIQVRSSAGLADPHAEQLAERMLNREFDRSGAREAIAAAMRDDVLYGHHGEIVVGRDAKVRYEPVPVVAVRNLVSGVRGKGFLEELAAL